MRGSIPPLALAFWRWAIALTVLLPLAVPAVRAERAVILRSWRILILLGVLGVGSFSMLAYLGLGRTTATNGVLLNSVAPVVIVVLSWLLLGQRLAARQAAGLLVSLAGVAAVVSRGDAAILRHLHLNTGDLWVLGAVLCWASYSVCLRWRPRGLSAVGFLGVTTVVGLLWVTPFYAWELWAGPPMRLTAVSLATLGYVGVFPSVLAYVFWNRGVAEVGASRAGLFLHLMPVFGTLLAVVFLGESLQPFHLAGMALIFSGIYLTTAGSGRRPA